MNDNNDGYKVTEYEDRTEWTYNGKLHRVGGPAVEFKNGSKHWYQNGLLHRDDGPALEWIEGDFMYAYHGLLSGI